MNISVFTVKHQWARHGKGTPKAVKKEKRKGKGWKIIQEEKDIAHVNCTTSLISCISWFWDLHIFDTDLNILTSHLLKNYDCGLHFYKILHGILSWNLQKDKEILYNKTIWMFITIMYSTIGKYSVWISDSGWYTDKQFTCRVPTSFSWFFIININVFSSYFIYIYVCMGVCGCVTFSFHLIVLHKTLVGISNVIRVVLCFCF